MNQEEKLTDMLSGFDTAMLITHSDAHGLSARPMAIAEVEEGGKLWFLTDRDSGKMVDLARDNHVAVTLQSENRFLALSGRAEIERKTDKIEELWSEKFQVWFPQGKQDPAITLLHVVPQHGEYWDRSGFSGMKYLLKAGIAYFRREQPSVDAKEHGSIAYDSQK